MDSAESLPYCVTKEILYSFLFFVDASWEWLEGGCSISPIVQYSDPPIWGSYRWCCLSCKRKRTFPETSDIKLYPSPHPIVQYPLWLIFRLLFVLVVESFPEIISLQSFLIDQKSLTRLCGDDIEDDVSFVFDQLDKKLFLKTYMIYSCQYLTWPIYVQLTCLLLFQGASLCWLFLIECSQIFWERLITSRSSCGIF